MAEPSGLISQEVLLELFKCDVCGADYFTGIIHSCRKVPSAFASSGQPIPARLHSETAALPLVIPVMAPRRRAASVNSMVTTTVEALFLDGTALVMRWVHFLLGLAYVTPRRAASARISAIQRWRWKATEEEFDELVEPAGGRRPPRTATEPLQSLSRARSGGG